jgi:hypothetical protein
MRALRSDAGVPLADVILRQAHARVTRVSVLDELFNPLPGLVLTGVSGYALDGDVSMDTGRIVRRTLSLTIANPKGVWTPGGPGDPFYWDKLIKVERGVRVGGVDHYAPLGIFLIDTPKVAGGELVITGADRLDRALRSKFTVPKTFTTGTRVGVALREMLEDAGVGASRWTVDDGGATLGADRSYEPDEERMSAAKTLATDFSIDVFADAEGYIVIRPKVNPAQLAGVWEFRAGADSNTLSISKSWSRDRFYNHVVAVGEAADKTPVRGEASITDPSSPLRVTGTMGDRLYTHKSAMITTVPQAQAVAQSLLWEHALIEEELAVSFVPHPGLEAGDAVVIEHPESKTNREKYVVDSIDMPLAGGAASLNVHRARLVI